MELELEYVESNLLQEKKDQQRYRSARNGDHLMGVPFQYDMCHLRNINRRDTLPGGKREKDTFIAVRRAQLDVLYYGCGSITP